jgi:hypothetical protein
MPTNESGLVRAIVIAVKRAWPDSFGWKVHGSPYQIAGLPDLVFCIRGHFIGLEAKHQRPGESLAHALGRATPAQLEKIQQINTAGGTAAVVTSVDGALALIREALGDNQGRDE